MNKEQKVNYVKCWLQKFGDRDNEDAGQITYVHDAGGSDSVSRYGMRSGCSSGAEGGIGHC